MAQFRREEEPSLCDLSLDQINLSLGLGSDREDLKQELVRRQQSREPYISLPTSPDLKDPLFKEVIDHWKWELGYVHPVDLKDALAMREVLVARVHEDLAGALKFHLRRDGVVKIYTIAVAPKFLRCGIGQKLVNSLQLLYPSAPMETKVMEKNERARSFFESLGFYWISVETARHSQVYLYRRNPHEEN